MKITLIRGLMAAATLALSAPVLAIPDATGAIPTEGPAAPEGAMAARLAYNLGFEQFEKARAAETAAKGKAVPKPFHYRDYGNLATIGRRVAVVALPGPRMSGWVAWVFWLTAHVFFLIGFRNRVVVLLDWAMAYWTYQRNARIVLGKDGRR
jgi:NADH dehydrogenase FAD-containing subunit